MSRIRSIKPTHWNDKELPKISLQAHLLWIATWNFSDDDGVFEADPLLLKSQIFPRRTDIRIDQINQWLDQLVKARFIIPFQYKGEGYYLCRTFKTHQRIDKAYPGIIPPDELIKVFQEQSTNVPRTVLLGEERRGEESKGVEKAPPEVLQNPFSESFLEVWQLWKDYKKKQHDFTYKSLITEQSGINDLLGKSEGCEDTARKIVDQSIIRGWKGFFKLKNENHGSHQQPANQNGKPGRSQINDIARTNY